MFTHDVRTHPAGTAYEVSVLQSLYGIPFFFFMRETNECWLMVDPDGDLIARFFPRERKLLIVNEAVSDQIEAGARSTKYGLLYCVEAFRTFFLKNQDGLTS